MTTFPRTLARFALLLAASATLGSTFAQDAPAPENDPQLTQYYTANALYNKRAYTAAISQYEAFLEEHGGHAKADLARQGLALSLYALKQYDKASPHLAALLAKGDLDAAVERERLVMMQGQCLMLTDQRGAARDLFVAEIDALRQDAYRAGAMAAVCDTAFAEADWAAVLDWSSKLLGAKPNPEQAARARYQAGYAHYQGGDAAKAAEQLGAIAGLGADPAWKVRADYLLGECHSLAKDYAKAEVAYAAALPGLEGADAAECRYRLGLARFSLGKHAEAAADLEAYAGAEGVPNAGEAAFYGARSRMELEEFDKAEPALARLARGDGDLAARASLWLARVATRRDSDYAKAAELLAPAAAKFKASAVADELAFDYANALIARPEPDFAAAAKLLGEIESRGEFAQMAEVLNQRAVCQHKLGEYEASLAANDAFLAAHGDHALAADARFMRAENLFLLDRLDEAGAAYAEFTAKHKDHPSATAAAFRGAQVHLDAGRWADCLKIAQPMLDDPPEGTLYAQLPFMVGDCHFRLEQWGEAVEALDAFLAPRVRADAVADEPNVDTALVQRAVAHDRLGAPEKALADLAVVARLPKPTPQLPLALAEQGRLAFEAGETELARTALERFLAEDAKAAEPFSAGAPAQRPRVHYYLGWIEAGEGAHAEAAAHFAKVVELAPEGPLAPDAALQQGVALVNLDDFKAAGDHFAAVLKRYPQHEKLPRLVFYTGLSLARQEGWGAAREHFKRVAEQFGDSEFADRALYEWAWCERRSEREAEATKLYERLIADHPGSPLAVKVQSELAELMLESGDLDKVIANLTATLEGADDAAEIEDLRYQLATAHMKKKDYATAGPLFEAMLKDYPESKLLSSILFSAGECRFQGGETVAALKHFSAAAAAEGDATSNLAESIAMRLAETQSLTGDHAAAAAGFRAFLAAYPESAWTRNAQFGLGFALESGGDSEAALPEYAKLLADASKVDQWAVRARFQTGECLFNLQRYDDAVTEFVHVEVHYSKYPQWQAKSALECARVLIAQGDKEAGAERLREVIERYPKQEAVRTLAGQLLDQLRAGG